MDTIEERTIDKINSIFPIEVRNIERINSIAHEVSWCLYNIIPENVSNQTFIDFDDPSIHKRIKHNSFQQSFTLFNTNVTFDIHNFDFHSKANIQYFLEIYGQKKLNEWIDFYKLQELNPIPNKNVLTLCSVLANKNPRRELLEENIMNIIKQLYNKLVLCPIVYNNGDYREVQRHMNDDNDGAFIATLLYYSQNDVINKIKNEWHNIFFETVPSLNREYLCTTSIFNILMKLVECKEKIKMMYNCSCKHYAQKWGFQFTTKQDLIELDEKLIFLIGKTLIDTFFEFWGSRILSFYTNPLNTNGTFIFG